MAKANGDQSLQRLFPETLAHSLEKVGEAARGKMPRSFGAEMLAGITKVVQDVKNAVAARPKLKTPTGFEMAFSFLEYPLKELHAFFTDEKHRFTNEDARIFYYFVQEQVLKLRECAEEVDEEAAKKRAKNRKK